MHPAVITAVVMALAACEEEKVAGLTPEERKQRRAEAEERERLREEQYRVKKQAEWDAVAAPFRAARAARKATMRAKGHGV